MMTPSTELYHWLEAIFKETMQWVKEIHLDLREKVRLEGCRRERTKHGLKSYH
jgi:hypothetical protein